MTGVRELEKTSQNIPNGSVVCTLMKSFLTIPPLFVLTCDRVIFSLFKSSPEFPRGLFFSCLIRSGVILLSCRHKFSSLVGRHQPRCSLSNQSAVEPYRLNCHRIANSYTTGRCPRNWTTPTNGQ